MVGNPLIGVKPQCRWHTDWEPSVDGVELTDLVWRLAQKGQFAAVPVVVGYNRDEGANLSPSYSVDPRNSKQVGVCVKMIGAHCLTRIS